MVAMALGDASGSSATVHTPGDDSEGGSGGGDRRDRGRVARSESLFSELLAKLLELERRRLVCGGLVGGVRRIQRRRVFEHE